MDIVEIFETNRPGNGDVSKGYYTYYRSGKSDDARCKGVTIAISIVPCRWVTTVDDRMMLVRLKHTLGFISIIVVYAPTDMCKLDSIVD